MPQRGSASQGRTCLRPLGGWQLGDNGTEVRRKHREQRLIALLGLSGERARPHVAGVLWPDSSDERALASLRRAVMQAQHARPGLLHAGCAFVGLDPAIEVDVAEVWRAAGVCELPESEDERSHLLSLLSAEELLPGWYDDWVLTVRERLQLRLLHALEELSRLLRRAGRTAAAVEAMHVAVRAEPLRESGPLALIEAHQAAGDWIAARRQYDAFRSILRREIGVEPSAELTAVACGTGRR